MAKRVSFVLAIFSIFCCKQVVGYYCDSDKCTLDEYCCGMNICCTSYAVYQMWYFWCGLVFFVILLTACAGFCRYRYSTSTTILISDSNTYSRLQNDPSSPHLYTAQNIAHGQYRDINMMSGDSLPKKYNIPSDYPPPPYSPGKLSNKDPNYAR